MVYLHQTQRMEVNFQLSILLAYIFNLCSATVIMKFGKLSAHYMKNLKNDIQLPDPMEELDLNARKLLCDSVIKARQFMQKFPQRYYERRKELHTSDVYVQWDLSNVSADTTWNYQRLPHNNASTLEYKLQRVQILRKYKKIKCLCCVHTERVKWYLTFGLVDHFMYLLEPSKNRFHRSLLLTAIIEPSALVCQKSLLYFSSQLIEGKSKMESIYKMSQGDRLRICSAIDDALGFGNRARLNYYKRTNYNHSVRKLHSRYGDSRIFKFLHCNLFGPERGEESFYALADIQELGAVFVFFEDEKGKTVAEMTRVTKIGALLNPFGTERKKKKKVLDEDFPTSDSDDESDKRNKELADLQKSEEISTQVLQSEADNAESSHSLGKQDDILWPEINI